MPTIVTPVATSAFTVYSGRANTKGRKGGVAQDVGLSEAQLAMVGNVVEGRSRRSIVANPLSDPEHMAAIAAAAAGYNKSRERRSSNSNIASDALAAVGSAKKAARGTMKKLRRSLTIHAVSDADKEDPDGEEVNRYIEQKVNERRSRRSFYEAAPRTGAEETMLPNPVNVDTNADHAKADPVEEDEPPGDDSSPPAETPTGAEAEPSSRLPRPPAPSAVDSTASNGTAGDGAAAAGDAIHRPEVNSFKRMNDENAKDASFRAPNLSSPRSRRRSVAISRDMGANDEAATAGFSQKHVGTFSCPGMDDGISKTNQDFACLSHPVSKQPGTALFCVFDGHGKLGHDVSREALYQMHHEIERSDAEMRTTPGPALTASFTIVNERLKALCGYEAPPDQPPAAMTVDALESGACALVAYMLGKQLCVAGAGDVRCVLGTRSPDGSDKLLALPLSTDHKVDLPAEQERLEAAGSWVRPEIRDEGEFEPARLYVNKGAHPRDKPRGGPGLCVSRVLGDLNAVKAGVIPTPEIMLREVVPEDEYLIIASDGVWEFIDNDEAVAIVEKVRQMGGSADAATRYLIGKAALCWRHFEGDYRDDITAIVVYLQPVAQMLSRELAKSLIAKSSSPFASPRTPRGPDGLVVEDVSARASSIPNESPAVPRNFAD